MVGAGGPRRHGPTGPGVGLGRPWAPRRPLPLTNRPPAGRARASAPATAAAASTMPSTTTAPGEAPSPPSAATLTSTISATGPSAPAKRAAAVLGAPLSAACHAPMAPAAAAATRPQGGEEDGGQRAALGPSLSGVADHRGDEEQRDEDAEDHRAGARADAARDPAAIAGVAEQARVAVSAHRRPTRSERTTSSMRAPATWLSDTPMLRFTRVLSELSASDGDDPRRLDPAAGGHRPLDRAGHRRRRAP